MHTFTTTDPETSCLASTLECLLHSPQLVNYLLDKTCVTEDINTRKRNAAALVKEVGALARHKWDKGETHGDLSLALAALRKYSKGATANTRQCTGALLQGLHDGLSKVSRLPPSLAHGGALDAWDTRAKASYSFLTELFQGQLLRDIDGVYDHFWDIALAGRTGDMLQDLVDKHFTGTMVTYAPLLLLIHVDAVDTYPEALVVGGCSYDLYALAYMPDETSYAAVCEHRGHWTLFKDGTCTPTTPPSTHNRVRLLCYKKNIVTAMQS